MSGQKKNGLAIASLILGILSLVLTGILTAIPGVITGHMARSRIRNFPESYTGGGMAMFGLVLNYLVLILSIIAIAVLGYLYSTGELQQYMDMFTQQMQAAQG